ncbi:MAG: hypothetical protein MJ249_13625 [Kiritimatiellae bacterium]|nr:hypothetical protein [Kiritimatiellia bacterium]
MRKRNRRVKKNVAFTTNRMGVIALIICVFLVGIAYWTFDARCVAIQHEIGKAEKVTRELNKDLQRETATWSMMTSLGKLDERLNRHGLEMQVQKVEQIVNMNRDGRPKPNQLSVARARNRMRNISNVAFSKDDVSQSMRTMLPLRGTKSAAKGRTVQR